MPRSTRPMTVAVQNYCEPRAERRGGQGVRTIPVVLRSFRPSPHRLLRKMTRRTLTRPNLP